jgi:hypothetical protein
MPPWISTLGKQDYEQAHNPASHQQEYPPSILLTLDSRGLHIRYMLGVNLAAPEYFFIPNKIFRNYIGGDID